MTLASSLSDSGAALAAAWLARPALSHALDVRASARVHQWLERAVPELDALLHETLAFPQLARFERLRALPEPLPHISWPEALKRYRAARLRAIGRLDARDRRVATALVDEFAHVVRIVLKHRHTPAAELLSWPLLAAPTAPAGSAQGFCDAARRPDGRTALGAVLRSANGTVLARIAAPTRAQDIVQAEAQALVATLSCARALRLERLVLHTDASGLASLLNGKGLLAYCVEEGQAQQLARQFAQLAVLKVPRLLLFEADRLAAHALAHA